jgi:hypothetical protein
MRSRVGQTTNASNWLRFIQPQRCRLSQVRVNSLSGTVNSAFSQFRQTDSCGKTQTTGLSTPISPGKWMPISAVNLLCLSDPHVLHDTVRLLSEPIIAGAVISRYKSKGLDTGRQTTGNKVKRLSMQRKVRGSNPTRDESLRSLCSEKYS